MVKAAALADITPPFEFPIKVRFLSDKLNSKEMELFLLISNSS